MKFNKIKCGITGHTGVLGSELIKKNKKIRFIKFKGDISNKKNIQNWFRNNKFDIIIHLAAIVPTKIVKKNYKLANKINYFGTKLLVDEILKKQEIQWFFYSSTSHVYKFSKNKISENGVLKPISKYGLTKLRGENYIIKKLKKKVPYCIGRIFSFTNNKQSKDYIIPAIFNKAKSKKKEIIFKDTNHFRDFLCVKDICNAILILKKNKATGIYNIGSGKKVSLSNIIKIILEKYKKKYIIVNKNIQTCLVANNSKIKKLNWKPTKNIQSIIKELF